MRLIFLFFILVINVNSGFNQSISISLPESALEEDVICQEIAVIVDEMPTFPGGFDAMMNFISSNIQYPEEALNNGIEGRVVISFVINKKGEIIQPTIKRDIGGGCGQEGLRIVSLMPKWTAGKQSKESVCVSYNLPIKFSLTKNQK